MRLNSNGISTSSSSAGINIPRLAPSAASLLTQSDLTDAAVHRTIRQRAAPSASSMTFANVLPGGMILSHHTDHPWRSKDLTTGMTLFRSSLA